MTRKLTLIILLNLFSVYAVVAQTADTVNAPQTAATTFTYQGKLTDGSVPAAANYDFEFRLYDAVSGGTQQGATVQKLAVPVATGIFTASLDFGNQFPGADRFLDISVRPAGSGLFTPLTPRQAITSAPHAVRSLSAATADTATNATNAVNATNVSGGTVSGDGSGITNINGGNISSGTVTVNQLAPDVLDDPARNRGLLGSLRWDLLKQQISVTVGSTPKGLAFDGVNIWVANSGAASVTKVRASDGSVQGTFAVGTTPTGVAFDGANIWVTNQGSNNVTKLRASDGALQGTFNVGFQPQGIAFDGANIWTANTFTGNVTKLRASDGANQGTFSVGANPVGIAFDGANMWVMGSGNVTKLRASDGSTQGTFTSGVGGGLTAIVFDGTWIWLQLSNKTVMKFTTHWTNAGTFTTLQSGGGLGFDGTNMWFSGFTQNSTIGTYTIPNVLKLRASDGASLAFFPANFPAGGSPGGIAFDGHSMWVADSGSGTVTRLPPAFP